MEFPATKVREITRMEQFKLQTGIWSGGLYMLVPFKQLMLMFIFVAFNVESSVY